MDMTNLMSRASKLTKSSVSAACLASALVLGPSAPTMAQSSQVQQYTVRACNQINERVYLALAFPVSSPKWQFDAEGWWYIDPGDCLLINMNEIWARAGVQDSMMPNSGQPIRPNTFFYAETRGLFGGAIKKVWEADKGRSGLTGNIFCIRMDKSRSFRTKRGFKDPQNPNSNEVYSTACSASAYEKVNMEVLSFKGSPGTTSKVAEVVFSGQ